MKGDPYKSPKKRQNNAKMFNWLFENQNLNTKKYDWIKKK